VSTTLIDERKAPGVQHPADEPGESEALRLFLRRDAAQERDYSEWRPNVAGDSW
jgi:hypothetical protein